MSTVTQHTASSLRDEIEISFSEGDPETVISQLNGWLQRGDGVAIYENVDLGHPQLGHRKFVSFGSADAQLEVPEPPEKLPDIGGEINFRYYLRGVYRGTAL